MADTEVTTLTDAINDYPYINGQLHAACEAYENWRATFQHDAPPDVAADYERLERKFLSEALGFFAALRGAVTK